MFKKSKLPLAVTLLVQSITFFILFCILWGKKKSIASAFLAVSAMSGFASGYLIAEMKKEISETSVEFDDEFDLDEADLRADLERFEDDELPEEV